ncbi:MAG TPA: protein translocase subunit SecF [Oligoflexia bacterium]|nr:protein translocase subunit SecF [Oligoflexia bacterium]HMR24121.1 protein translocase subunit SecF [Oligoflexia bacterium]
MSASAESPKNLGFFRLVPLRPRVPFVKVSKVTLWVSVVILISCAFLLMTRGLNYGVDFKGGTQMHVRFNQEMDAAKIRSILEPLGLSNASVQDFGEQGGQEFLIRIPPEEVDYSTYSGTISQALGNPKDLKLRFGQERVYVFGSGISDPEELKNQFNDLGIEELHVASVTAYGSLDQQEWMVQFAGTSKRVLDGLAASVTNKDDVEVLQIESVGAKVGRELRNQAIGSVLFSIMLILIYIWFRFDLEFAPGAILALVHDALFVLGIFSLFQLQFDLSIVAAVLTIVGFSINDTIVVYDRVRENLQTMKGKKFEDIVNVSVNETLSRTLLTSGTLFLAAIALLYFGGPITENFALSFTIGVVVGTYSTIFIASPLTIYFYKYFQKRKATR